MQNEHEQRRHFLKSLAAMSAAALLSGEPRRVWADEKKLTQPKATADSCILLWMGGGMAAPDTFDPKKYVPFAPGVKVADIESTFPAIDTVVDNIKITQGLENVARVMDRGTLIRGFSELGPPMQIGPRCPPLADGSDPLGWHGFAPLGPHGTRRTRQ